MKQVLFRQGRPIVEDVPAPAAVPGCVLVRVAHSCISAGTEASGLTAGGVPLWRRAWAQPEKLIKTMKMAATHGIRRTAEIISTRLNTSEAVGYAAAGTIIECASDITDLRPGDVVACAGALWANHAQFICVPRQLVALVPRGVSTEHACTATLGAIALHGVRRANPTLGETFVVLGLGLVGQLVAQILRSNGCAVLGLDPDTGRVNLARELGMSAALPDEESLAVDRVHRLTAGHGADGVIITAASPSDRIASTAFAMCRRKGRVVLVGDVGLHLNRADFYAKEIDFLISSSYGPGRYDHRYESDGLDYPIGYVRWTEGRNLEQFLRMLTEGSVKIAPLIGAAYPVADAEKAYATLTAPPPRPLITLLAYPHASETTPDRVVANPKAKPTQGAQLGVAIIGAGLFAREMHLPNLRKLGARIHLHAVMSRTGHHASDAARRFGATLAVTDLDALLTEDRTQAVLITTRHDSHARLTLAALRAGKHALVEKPLALTREELRDIESFFADREQTGAPVPLLFTSFNRRFSPHVQRLGQLLTDRQGPMMIHYRCNAQRLAPDHWVHGPEGGGRNIGEACHFYDLFTALTNARATRVTGQPIRQTSEAARRNENFTASISFDDGSLATLTYTTLGHGDLPKERMEIFADGVAYVLDDYRTLEVIGSHHKGVNTRTVDKGHFAALQAFITAAHTGGDWPIPLWQQIQSARLALDIEDAINADTPSL